MGSNDLHLQKKFSEFKIPLTPKSGISEFFPDLCISKTDGDFFAKFSGFVAIQIARMAFLSNWGRPPIFGGTGGQILDIFGWVRAPRHLVVTLCKYNWHNLIQILDNRLP